MHWQNYKFIIMIIHIFYKWRACVLCLLVLSFDAARKVLVSLDLRKSLGIGLDKSLV